MAFFQAICNGNETEKSQRLYIVTETVENVRMDA